MSAIIVADSPTLVLHRVSFTNSLVALTPNDIVKQKPPSRFDDPQQEFRVLYAASTRTGAYIETMQDLRPNLAALSALQGIIENDSAYARNERAPAVISDLWILDRYVGTLTPDRALRLVDLADQRTIENLRAPLASVALARGMTDISASSFMGGDRKFTMAAARLIYDMPERYDGVLFQSALGAPYTNIGLFEEQKHPGVLRAPLTHAPALHVSRDDPALRDALDRLDLTLENQGIRLSRDDRQANAVDRDHELVR